MAFSTVLFDLDGTLLPMDQDVFVKAYFKGLAGALTPRGYAPETVIQTVWQCVHAMIKNDGSHLNETVFWDSFCQLFGNNVLNEKPILEEFYHTEFNKVQQVCGYDKRAAIIVRALKANGIQVVLATNPVFPAIATESRMRWAGLTPGDFAWYTTYENSHYCKPNLAYYEEILHRIRCAPENCIMVGNDVGEDMVAQKLGMDVFLLTDCLINQNKDDITSYPHGSFDELAAFLNIKL